MGVKSKTVKRAEESRPKATWRQHRLAVTDPSITAQASDCKRAQTASPRRASVAPTISSPVPVSYCGAIG